MLTAHFSRRELNYDAAPPTVRVNLEALARLLEDVRAAIGAPLRVTSGYRSVATNAGTAGASATSQHLDGTAADVVPVGVDPLEAMRRLEASPVRSRWGQVIAYPYGTHLHIALPTRGKVGEMLVQSSADSSKPRYLAYSPSVATAYGTDAKSRSVATLALAAAGAGGVAILNRKGGMWHK